MVIVQAKDYSDLKYSGGSEDRGMDGFKRCLRGKIHRA